jgi:hypothetical protein
LLCMMLLCFLGKYEDESIDRETIGGRAELRRRKASRRRRD